MPSSVLSFEESQEEDDDEDEDDEDGEDAGSEGGFAVPPLWSTLC